MAATSSSSLSSILTPPPSSSYILPFHKFHTHFSLNLTYINPKPLTLKHQSFTLFPLCTSSASFNDVQGSIFNKFGDDPDDQKREPVTEEEEEEEFDDDNDDEIKGSGPSYGVDECRLFVGNLPFSVTSPHLSQTFSQAGLVRFAEVIYDKVTSRSRGFGFVTMGNIDEAKEAIRMFDGSQIGGRTVKVNFPEVPRGGERKVMGPKIRSSNQSFVDTPHKIYAGNLGWSVSSQALREAFAAQPGFVSAKVVYERNTGKSRGFGFVSFSSPESAESAIDSLNGVELEGRPMRLNMAAEKARFNTTETGEQSESFSTISS